MSTFTVPEQQFPIGQSIVGPFDVTNPPALLITLASSEWGNVNTDHFSIVIQRSADGGATWQDDASMADVVWGTLAGKLHSMPSLSVDLTWFTGKARFVLTFSVPHKLGATITTG